VRLRREKTTPTTPSADRLDGCPGLGQQATTSMEGRRGSRNEEGDIGEGVTHPQERQHHV